MFLDVHQAQGLVLSPHVLSFSPFFQSLLVIELLVPPQLVLDVSRILKRELIHGVVEVDQGVVVTQLVVEDVAAGGLHLVVSQVQRQQRFVNRKKLEQLNHSLEVRSVHRQLVAFEVQEFKRLVHLESSAEGEGALNS